jgi:hypothetical protein
MASQLKLTEPKDSPRLDSFVKASGTELPVTVSPRPIRKANPRKDARVPIVTINGGSFAFATRSALMMPRSSPDIAPTRKQSGKGRSGLAFITTPHDIAEQPKIEPTEMSIPPLITTRSSPRPTVRINGRRSKIELRESPENSRGLKK